MIETAVGFCLSLKENLSRSPKEKENATHLHTPRGPPCTFESVRTVRGYRAPLR